MTIKREGVEVRSYQAKFSRPAPAVETRDAGGEAPAPSGTIEGYAAVFNTPIDFGDWQEVLLPGCFDESLAANDVMAMWDHSSRHLLGRTSSGTLRLAADGHGLKMGLDLPVGTYIGDYVRTMADRGDVHGASIMFWVVEEEWVTNVKPYLRVIKKVDLLEAGPVHEPAAPDAKIALARMKAAVPQAAEPPPAGEPGAEAPPAEPQQGEAEARSALEAWRDRASLRFRLMKM